METGIKLTSIGEPQDEDTTVNLSGSVFEVEETRQNDKKGSTDMELSYSIEEVPPWYLCILLGIQHYLTAFGGMVSIPLLLAPALCLGPNDVGTAEILSTLIFMSGLVTVLQTTIGTRLPIIQGGTFSFLAPTFAILNLPKWDCPDLPDVSNTTLYNDSVREYMEDYREELWHARMREIQGAIMLASLFQVVVGASGLVGILLTYIGPLAIAPTIGLIGFALFSAASEACQGQWWISIATMVCILLFSQYLNNYDIPCCVVKKSDDGDKSCMCKGSLPLFKLFPMMLSICVMWFICYILTITDTLPPDPDEWGYLARTDVKEAVLNKARWFRFPYPFQWGIPTFSVAGVFGMLAGVIAGMLESIGDYYACARLSGAPPPPLHAVNRGIMVEGIGCVLAGMWGSGSGTTSYSENVGAIGITKVGSRIVVQVGGIIMVILGMIGKFGAIFVTIPDPVMGGVVMVTFGMITSVGMSNLQYVNMNSSRNLCIVGFSFFFGLSLSQWMEHHPESINTGNDVVDQIFTVLLSTSMFVGGAIGFILDNTIPGTAEERGIHAWRLHLSDDDDTTEQDRSLSSRCYDVPWCMGCIRRVKCFKYFPICPTFSFVPSCKTCRGGEDDQNDNVIKQKKCSNAIDNSSYVDEIINLDNSDYKTRF